MKKILIIRFSSIGDIVLTTPVVRCIKLQYPDVEIHFLTKKAFEGILINNPHITKIFTLNDNFDALVDELKNESYDFVIDLHHNIRSARIRSKLGKPYKAFNKLNIQKWVLVNFKINKLPKTHIVNRYLMASPFPNLNYDGQGLDYFIPAKDVVQISQLPHFCKHGYLAMAIGAQHATKRLPVERIKELSRLIKYPIVLLGGKEDYETGAEIEKELPENVYNGCGQFNLNQSASLVQQSRMVITHDTGLMHIAAALRKQIISIWGNTIPEFGMYPFLPDRVGASAIFENKSITCRPCSKIGFQKCPRGHFKCMNDLNLNLIAEQVESWWQSTTSS